MIEINPRTIQNPESISYDAKNNRIITSNIVPNGSVYSYYFENANHVITVSQNELSRVSTPNITYGIAGIKVDPTNSSLLWGAAGNFFHIPGSPCLIVQINTVTKKTINTYNFNGKQNVAAGGNCFIDDIVIQASSSKVQAVYATDYLGYQVLN